MSNLYARTELLRVLRNRQNFVFSIAIPLALFLFIAGEQPQA